MRKLFTSLAALAMLVTAHVEAQTAYRAPRLAGTTQPNLNGLWQSITEANWDLLPHEAKAGPPEFGALYAQPAGVGIVEGDEIPYQPWALERKKENFAN